MFTPDMSRLLLEHVSRVRLGGTYSRTKTVTGLDGIHVDFCWEIINTSPS